MLGQAIVKHGLSTLEWKTIVDNPPKLRLIASAFPNLSANCAKRWSQSFNYAASQSYPKAKTKESCSTYDPLAFIASALALLSLESSWLSWRNSRSPVLSMYSWKWPCTTLGTYFDRRIVDPIVKRKVARRK